jgi:phosphatidate cytidylyltransferase
VAGEPPVGKGPDATDPDELEPVSGDAVDAVFEVEHHGEDPETLDDGVEVPESAAPGEEAEFTVDPQVGESPPPEAADAVVGDDGDDGEEWPWGDTEPAAVASAGEPPAGDLAPGGLKTPEPTPEPGEAVEEGSGDGHAAAEPEPPQETAVEPDRPDAAGPGPGPDLGLGAVVVPAGAADAPGTGPPDWDPPPSTDALFPADELSEGADDGEAPDGDAPPLAASGEGDELSGDRDLADDDLLAVGDVPPVDALGAAVAGAELGDPFGDWPAPDEAAASGATAPIPEDEPADWATFTDEHYLAVSQSDYLELADLGLNEPDAAPSAVAASIPGLDSGVVGLEDVVEEPQPPAASAAAEAPASRSATDVGLRAITALGLLVLFAAALVHPLGLTVIAVILFALAAGEFYAVLVRTGQHPLSLFGLLGAAGGLIGAAVWGLGAIPVAIIATLVAVALYYALTSSHPDPLTDGGLTVMVVAWAMLGAFVFPIVDSPEFRWWVAAIVIVVVAMDVGQYFVGRSIGSRPLAPMVSPKKTVEGLLGGVAVAVVAAVVLSFLGPLTLPSMLALAGATVVLAPLGDLSVSLVKRIIGVKDMGTILPGHGGILDRVDGLLFVVPAAWVIFDAMGLLT